MSWRNASTSWTSKPRNIRTVNCCCRTSSGVMRIAKPSSGEPADVPEDWNEKHLKEVDRQDRDHWREVQPDLVGRQDVADRAKHGRGDPVDELNDRVVRIRIHP